MKNVFFAIAVIAMFAIPLTHAAGAQKYSWHLSGAVMPVPPYGLSDIPGSATASKLIVNQPNGNVKVTITGAMGGLTPDTTYTVYLSSGYTPYTQITPISVVGTWKWLVLSTYEHDMVITNENPDGTFVGYGGYLAGCVATPPCIYTETITGQVTGSDITFTTTYDGTTYSFTATGTIALDGTMSGTSDLEWHTTAGAAILGSGSTSWPGLFTSTVQPFTFTTDGSGSGSWHINLRAADLGGAGSHTLSSVWINGGGATVLISDPFTVN